MMFLPGILDGPLGGGSGSSSMELLNLLAFLLYCRLREVGGKMYRPDMGFSVLDDQLLQRLDTILTLFEPDCEMAIEIKLAKADILNLCNRVPEAKALYESIWHEYDNLPEYSKYIGECLFHLAEICFQEQEPDVSYTLYVASRKVFESTQSKEKQDFIEEIDRRIIEVQKKINS